jgi:uncharacterized protein (DUF2236 family)
MLTAVRKILGFQMTIAEWIGTAIILAAPYLHDLVALKMVNPLLRVPFRPLLRFLTAGFLAPVFRDALGVGWGPTRQRLFEWLFLLVSFANRFLPVFLRQGGSHLLLADVRRRVRTGRPLI